MAQELVQVWVLDLVDPFPVVLEAHCGVLFLHRLYRVDFLTRGPNLFQAW